MVHLLLSLLSPSSPTRITTCPSISPPPSAPDWGELELLPDLFQDVLTLDITVNITLCLDGLQPCWYLRGLSRCSHRGISFSETAATDAVLGYIIAFLVLLSTVKLWHLLRLNPKMNMITSALRRAWGDISGFVTVILIMLLAYSIAVSAPCGKTSGQGLMEVRLLGTVKGTVRVSGGLGFPREGQCV